MTTPLRTSRKATRQDTRDQNLRLALQHVATGSPTSRADIARATGLTRATVSDLVADLVAAGLVTELGPGPSSGGKPPELLALAPHGREVVCVDVSQDPFQGALVTLAGEIVHRAHARRRGVTGRAAETALVGLLDDLLAASNVPVLGIGIGTPGVVDPKGNVLDASHLDWHDLPLQTRMHDRFGHAVHVTNDSQGAALAEFAAGPVHDGSLVVVRIGVGIGAGIVLDGRRYRGERSAAGEIGHVTVVERGERCACGNIGCLETVASVPAITHALAAAGPGGDGPVLAAAGGYLGRALANVVGILDVRHIVLAGEIARFGQPLLDAARAELCRRVLPTMAADVDVRYSALGEDIVLLGAAALVVHAELGVVGL